MSKYTQGISTGCTFWRSGCREMRVLGSPFCSVHDEIGRASLAAEVSCLTCGRPNRPDHRYCLGHSLREPQASGALFCATWECCNNQSGGSAFCSNHKCRVDGCMNAGCSGCRSLCGLHEIDEVLR